MTLLPSRLAVADLARRSVGAVCAAVDLSTDALDPRRIAHAYLSTRLLRIDGATPAGWDPLSGFWATSDGWVRTHANYPHHGAALRSGLGLPADAGADAVRRSLAERDTTTAVSGITAAGGLAVAVLAEVPETDARLRSIPLVETAVLDDGSARPAHRSSALGALPVGVRVLDLTRVIAGPVCTRTLALLGADVLRIDPPGLPEPEGQHLDTGHGKRTAVLDATSSAFESLLAEADVVVLGYRPAGLARIGLSPEAIAARHPGLVIAQLSAWGTDRPERRGFDSLVQAESGIAVVEAAPDGTPGALPAQALDHSAGYLLAAAVCTALRSRHERNGSQILRTSLRRMAAELLGMPRSGVVEPAEPLDPAAHTQTFAVAGRTVTTVRSVIPGFEHRPPHPFGSDAAHW